MEKIIISTDSTADLSKDLFEEFNIQVLPLKIIFDDIEYTDGVDLDSTKLYEEVNRTKHLPKTSTISIELYKQYFASLLCDDPNAKVIHIGIGAKLSGSYANAIKASQEFEKGVVNIVDSKNLSSATGLLLIRASKMVRDGKSSEEIIEDITKKADYVKAQFVVPTMDYLYKGGRCSALSKFFGTVLKIKPIIAVREGVLGVYQKTRGEIKAALDSMIEMIVEDFNNNNVEIDEIMVTHSLGDESAEYIIKELNSKIQVERINNTPAGAVISSHCGKGTIGILYITKNLVK